MAGVVGIMELLILGIVATILFGKGVGAEHQRVCWYTLQNFDHIYVQHMDTSPDYSDDTDYGGGLIQGPNLTCPKTTNYCYTLWKKGSNRSSDEIIILAQGCWETSGKQDCETDSCVTSRKPPKALNDTNFCCCRGDFCNGNVTQMYHPDENELEADILPTSVVKHIENSYLQLLIVLLILFIFVLSCFPALILRSRRFHKEKQNSSDLYPDSVHLMENGNLYNSNFTIENLKLEKVLGQGRYGIVWKGSMGSQEVAVKMFPSQHKNYFYNELDIYCVPFMTHPSLLSYFGHDEHVNAEGNTEYFLFLSLAPNGTVHEYLQSNVLDWATFCKMALSISKGIAYLHSDIRKGDKFKPCISHRDLNTKNILVKEDLSCVICDLGFATKINGSKYYYNGEEQHAEIKSINDVGTLRYMSPEVLEGAVNLRDCETSLKQIDVYALGLILWELSTRCSDFYPPGVECAPYRLPFQLEIDHPTFEQMQILVCRHKARPLFPDLWRDSPAVRSVRETIEDCWDQDAEARLTALCVEERFHELLGISERQKVGLHPCGISPTTRLSLIQKDPQNLVTMTENKEESCASESTVETLLAITPSTALTNCKNSNLFQGLCPAVQPYQGRNPCLERNLMLTQDCDSNSGELIDKSHKNISIEPSSLLNDLLNVHSFNPTNSTFSNSGHNSYLNRSEPVMRSNAPIPFLQNVNVDSVTPKLSNLPRPSCERKKMSWKNFKKFFEIKRKAEDVSPQIDYNVKSQLIDNENCLNLTTPTASTEPKLETQVSLSNGKPETKILIEKDFTTSKSPEAKALEAALAGRNIKRPTVLPLLKNTDISTERVGEEGAILNAGNMLKNIDRFSNSENLLGRDYDKVDKADGLTEVEELKILRLESDAEEVFHNNSKRNLSSQKSLVKSKIDVKNFRKKEGQESTCQDCQPSEEVSVFSEENEIQLKKPESRVKTPGDISLAIRKMRGSKNAKRFSLYDDRIMSGSYDDELLLFKEETRAGDRREGFNSFENIKFDQSINQVFI